MRLSDFKVKIAERWLVMAGIGLLGAIAVAGLVLAIYAAWLFHDLPDAGELADYRPATATRVYAGAHGKDPEFYALVRSLEAYEKSITPETEMVMSTDSELFRYLARPTEARGTFSSNR